MYLDGINPPAQSAAANGPRSVRGRSRYHVAFALLFARSAAKKLGRDEEVGGGVDGGRRQAAGDSGRQQATPRARRQRQLRSFRFFYDFFSAPQGEVYVSGRLAEPAR